MAQTNAETDVLQRLEEAALLLERIHKFKLTHTEKAWSELHLLERAAAEVRNSVTEAALMCKCQWTIKLAQCGSMQQSPDQSGATGATPLFAGNSPGGRVMLWLSVSISSVTTCDRPRGLAARRAGSTDCAGAAFLAGCSATEMAMRPPFRPSVADVLGHDSPHRRIADPYARPNGKPAGIYTLRTPQCAAMYARCRCAWVSGSIL